MLEELKKNRDNEIISAFAFNTGRLIEDLIKDRIGSLEEDIKILEAKILNWYKITGDKEFASYIGIESSNKGIIK